jgi:hypothetical protein
VRLSIIRLGFSLSIIFAFAVFSVGVVNLIWPNYGIEFLKMVDSIYPGYQFGKWGFGGVIVGTLYAGIDGFFVGVVLAWLYNLFYRKSKEQQ